MSNLPNKNIQTVNTMYGTVKYNNKDCWIKNVLETGHLYGEKLVLHNLHNYISKSKVILDIGAHIGCHSLLYAHLNTKAKIYSFELQTHMYKLLKDNILNNGIDNVEVFNCAIGDSMKMISVANVITDGLNPYEEYSYDSDKEYNFGGVSIGHGTEEHLMITIDSLNLTDCDFIKIDVEGFEYFVLVGAIKTLVKFKPVIFFESNQKTLTNYMKEVNNLSHEISGDMNVFSMLRSIGYKNIKCIDEEELNYLAIF